MPKALQIIKSPNEILHKKCKEVEKVTPEIQSILDNILETIYQKHAIGLAGPHVGVDLQVVVMNADEPVFMVNPEITKTSDETVSWEERSVSFPDAIVQITRHRSVTVKFLDYDGNEQVQEFTGLEAICAQHEIDQMNGITILDRAEQNTGYKPRVLPLITEPDPILHISSKDVDVIDDDIRNLMQDMLATMYKYEGIGLAAVQVGVHLNVIVIDIDFYHSDKPMHGSRPLFMVNPRIIEKSEEQVTFQEGCLSLPTVRSEVIRNEKITVEYLDYNGSKQTLHCDGLLSICVQHEVDHTNGIVFIDRISRLKKEFFIKKLKKIKQKA